MKKHLIAWGILSTMFMANTFAQKDIDRPIMGWSSWNTYHVNISEELIKQQADALINHGLKEAGYNYINIDDGFFGHRDETGKMHPHPDRFPNGMKVVSDYI
ncbi:alpha-galactosidase, partial [Bacteroides thetaiotaomicron]